MPRGLPDFYNPDYGVAGSSRDLNPLILAALGFNSVDGLGRVLYVDDFQTSINHWTVNSTGLGVDPVLSNDYADHGLYSAKCDPGVGVGDGLSYIRREFVVQECNRAGAETSIYLSVMPSEIAIDLTREINGTAYSCWLSLDVSENTLYIYDGSDWIAVFTDLNLSSYNGWLQVKIVVDYTTFKYAHLIIGQQKYDLSQYDLFVWDTGETKTRVDLELAAYKYGADENPAYFGHVILTVDEP